MFFVFNQKGYFLINKNNLPVNQQVKNSSFELKDISTDPRFADENFIKFIPTYDLNPCLDEYLGNLKLCPTDTFEKEIIVGVKAVIKLHTEANGDKVPFLEFHNNQGRIQSIPEIRTNGLPSIAYVDQNFILLAFTCDECGT